MPFPSSTDSLLFLIQKCDCIYENAQLTFLENSLFAL